MEEVKQTINTYVISFIRTLTPTIVGQFISWLALAGILDNGGEISAQLIVALNALFTAVYYAGVRLLEEFVSKKFGWLLGYAKKPEYKG